MLIDNDYRFFATYVDYAHYLTQALDAAGVSYQLWDADAHFGNSQTLPDLDELRRFPAIIWHTGDNLYPDGHYAVSTPLTALDMHLLASYLDAGGRLLAIGQNLAEASDVNADEDPTWGRAEFYHTYLGSHWLQGSVFDPAGLSGFPPKSAIGVVGMPESFLAGIELDLGEVGDGAGNQSSVDEVGPGGLKDESDIDLVRPVMFALNGYPVRSSYVAVIKSDEPTLDRRSVSIPYRSAYYAFGLEGINDSATSTSRSAFMRRTIDWLLDQVHVTLAEDNTGAANRLARIRCSAASSAGAEMVSYRWKVGQGQKARTVNSSEPSIVYLFEEQGSYPVSVEATDSLGHKAVADGNVVVLKGGSSSLTVDRLTAFPGDTLTYDIAASNSEPFTVSFAFSFTVPAGTDYLFHEGDGSSFADGTLAWSGDLPPNESFEARMAVKILDDIEEGTEIIGLAQFVADEGQFIKVARTRVILPQPTASMWDVHLPVIARN